jgi:hypothetical protein
VDNALRGNTELSSLLGFTMECGRVQYTKRERLPAALSDEQKSRLGWLQKPPTFEAEHEYRICLFTPLELDRQHVFLEVGDLSDISRIVYRPTSVY